MTSFVELAQQVHLSVDLGNFNDLTQQISSHSVLFAQYNDTLGQDVQKAWNNFVVSGQAWALMIGLMIGYFFCKLTSY